MNIDFQNDSNITNQKITHKYKKDSRVASIDSPKIEEKRSRGTIIAITINGRTIEIGQ